MLVFLFGKDTFRSLEKLKEITLQYRELKKEAIDLKIIDCENAVFSTLETEFQANSLFKIKKLLVFKNAFLNKELLEKLQEWKKFLKETADTVVFFEQGDVARSHALAKFLLEHAKVQEFVPLGLASLKTWLQREFKKYNVGVGSGVLNKVARVCGNDLWSASQEIQKLAAFAKAKGASLGEQDTAFLLKEPLETDIFFTVRQLMQGNKKAALELLRSHIEKGESPFYLLSMLAWGVRNLAKIMGAPAQRIADMHENVFKSDLAMKTGRVEPAHAVFSLALRL